MELFQSAEKLINESEKSILIFEGQNITHPKFISLINRLLKNKKDNVLCVNADLPTVKKMGRPLKQNFHTNVEESALKSILTNHLR